MPFQKNRTKTGGRKPGSTNRATTDIKSKIAALIDEQFDSVVEDLKALEPKERIAAYQRFIEYVLPKQREQKIDLSSLSDAELDDILTRALNKLQ